MAAGDIDKGTEELRGLLAGRPSWATIMRSFADRGLITTPPGLDIAVILEASD